MAKNGKLTKLKSVLKKLNSFSKRHHSTVASSSSSSSSDDNQLFPVFVGKSRRRYLVSADVICNPIFRELVDRSGEECEDDSFVTVKCEVVMFEHLLWMLEHEDHHEEASDHELVEYYSW